MGKDSSLRNIAVAITVILLVVMLLPLLLRFFSAANGGPPSECLRRLHALGMGVELYRHHSDGEWPQGRTSAECLGKLYPGFVGSLETFSCPDKPTRPRQLADGSIFDSGFVMDIAIPKDADPLRVIMADRPGNRPGGAFLLFVSRNCEFAEEVDGRVPNPYIPEDTDIYSDQPDLDDTKDCNLGGAGLSAGERVPSCHAQP